MTSRATGRLAGAILALATSLLEPGSVRSRYRAEFQSEQWELSGPRQLAHAVAVLARMPQLRSTLVETGALAFPHSSLWCRARLHHRWRIARTDDGRCFERCRDCGLDNDETYLTAASAVAGAALRGPPQ